MIARVWNELRHRFLARRAAAWVVAIDEDQERHAPGLRRWVGRSDERASLYNQAYRAYHGAAVPARRLYGSERERGSRTQEASMWQRNGRYILTIGCALVVIAFGARLILVELDIIERNHQAHLASLDYATRVGEIRTVRLPDGSKVILDTGTHIRVAFTPDRRRVTLDRGRARFEVAHDAAWPFVVSAGGGTVTAKGTVFDVDAEGPVRVRLISGAVTVAYPQQSASPVAAVRRLAAGEELRFDPAMRAPPVAPVRTSISDTRWTSPLRTFDDVAVADVLTEVNRYSQKRIMLQEPAMGLQHVFLDVDVRDSENVARAIATYLNLDVDRTADGDLILRPKTGLL